MAWDKTSRTKLGPQSVHELHVQNVYNDPDFAKDVDSITSPDSKSIKNIPEAERIAEKYAISLEEIEWYSTSYYTVFGFYRNIKSRPFQVVRENNLDKQYVYIRFRKNITKEDYMMAWDLIMSRFKKMPMYKSKNKLPDEYGVVYAIFKARQETPRPSFSEIFKRYQAGKLRGFSNHTNYFTNKDSFERYYNRYKPNQ